MKDKTWYMAGNLCNAYSVASNSCSVTFGNVGDTIYYDTYTPGGGMAFGGNTCNMQFNPIAQLDASGSNPPTLIPNTINGNYDNWAYGQQVINCIAYKYGTTSTGLDFFKVNVHAGIRTTFGGNACWEMGFYYTLDNEEQWVEMIWANVSPASLTSRFSDGFQCGLPSTGTGQNAHKVQNEWLGPDAVANNIITPMSGVWYSNDKGLKWIFLGPGSLDVGKT
jgi:hypothetical protein